MRPLDLTPPTRLAVRLAGDAAHRVADQIAQADPIPIPDRAAPVKCKPGTRREVAIPRKKRWSAR